MTTPFRIALTGGIGTGKTTVSSIFHQFGVPIIDSDLIARDIVKPGGNTLTKILDVFGTDIVSIDGNLDRKKLRTIIFNNKQEKTKLEEILHPAIYNEISNRIRQVDFPYCIIVIPLLIETNATKRYDRILLVDVPEEIQIERAAKRDNATVDSIQLIITSQSTRTEKLKYADDFIDNNVEMDSLKNSVHELHQQYMDLSAQNNENTDF